MKHPWLAYVIVGLLSIGAGVAIAGPPDNESVAATITPPTTTEAPAPTSTVAATTTSVASTTTSEPATTTSDAPSTDPDSETVPPEVPDRSEVVAAAANGSNVAGAAARAVTLLGELGYVDVVPLNGTDIVQFTTIYYADGFEEAAARMAADLLLLPEFVAPLDEAPAVIDLPADVELVAYIGRDRA